jgi:acyl-CoA thioester hydrolase
MRAFGGEHSLVGFYVIQTHITGSLTNPETNRRRLDKGYNMNSNFEWKINTSTYEFTVAFADTDAGGVVYHTKYLEHCERARGKYFSDIGVKQKSLLTDHNIMFVVTKDIVEFHSPAKFEDTVFIETQITKITGVRIIFKQEMYVGGVLKVTNEAFMACVDAASLKPQPIPEILTEVLCKSMERL